MALIEWYPPLKAAHVALVACSGSLFAVRAGASVAGCRWPLRTGWRVASVLVDTLLLAAGAALWAVLALDPLRDHWLAAKLVLLVPYVALGTLALRPGRPAAQRGAALIAAMALFLFIASVALMHDARGLFVPRLP
jgi:uncharacterized membrane protein SirB2